MVSPPESEKVFSFEECSRIVAAQAQEIARSRIHPTESCSLLESLGRVLAEELHATVVKLRHDSYRNRLDQLAQQSSLTAEEIAEFSDLSVKAAQIKALRGVSRDI